MTAKYFEVLYRMYGVYNLVFGLTGSAIAVTGFRRGECWAWWALLVGNTIALVSAITYDRAVNAIGPFEMTEYLGLAMVWVALAITAPFGLGRLGAFMWHFSPLRGGLCRDLADGRSWVKPRLAAS
jgi:hypothetical protein